MSSPLAIEGIEIASPTYKAPADLKPKTPFDFNDLTPVELRLMGGTGVGMQAGDEFGQTEVVSLLDKAVWGDIEAYKRVMTPINAQRGTKSPDAIRESRATLSQTRRLTTLFTGAFPLPKEVTQEFAREGIAFYIEPAAMRADDTTEDYWRLFLLTRAQTIHPKNADFLEKISSHLAEQWRNVLRLEKPAPLTTGFQLMRDLEPLANNTDGSRNFLVLGLNPGEMPSAFGDFAHLW